MTDGTEPPGDDAGEKRDAESDADADVDTTGPSAEAADSDADMDANRPAEGADTSAGPATTPTSPGTDPGESGGARDPLADLPGPDDSPTDLRAAAEGLVTAHTDYGLDFSPPSLDGLDDLVRSEFGGDEVTTTAVRAVGAYLGEVLVRDGGAWALASDPARDREARVVDLRPDGPSAMLDPFRLALGALRAGGRLSVFVRTDRAEESVSTVAFEAASTLVAGWPEFDFDLSPESLSVLDDLVDASPSPGDRGVALHAAALLYGSYFGQVACEALDAGWADSRADGFTLAVPAAEDGGEGVTVNVVEMASVRLTTAGETFEGVYEELLERR